MDFLIADTFTGSLARLTADEQRAVKTTAFDLQMDPSHPSMQLHRLERAKDDGFWSARVSRDLRLILHRSERSLLLCYVAHHDEAYRWAERRKLERHPKTGAAQLVEVRETVKDIVVPNYVEAGTPQAEPHKLAQPPLFANTSEEELLAYGVPPEWLESVQEATEDTLLNLADHLPQEAAEALLDLAVGVTPVVAQPLPEDANPFTHPDAQRRFRVMNDVEALERALEFPWEKWTVFLHPAQRELVERDYGGPARVAGSAGTGKTVVALHRAVFLARNDAEARVLLTTFSDSLANALDVKLRALVSNQPRLKERIDVHSLDAIAKRLYRLNGKKPIFATRADIADLLKEAAANTANTEGAALNPLFLLAEWEQIVDAWQLGDWESYRDVPRLGRRRRLPERQREVLWGLFERVRAGLEARGLVTVSSMYGELTALYGEKLSPFDHIVLDEAQDVSVAQLRFLAALADNEPSGKPGSLFFSGDLGQRIFEPPFSWKALGVDVRGRSHTLRINYRTSHQIRTQADRLLASELADVDGIKEQRRGTISIFNGPDPTIQTFDTPEDEVEAVSAWLKERADAGVRPEEMGVFVRSSEQLGRAREAVENAHLPFVVLGENYRVPEGHAAVSTMHYAKGLEFRAVVVMACDDEVLPLQERIEAVADDAELEEVYNTERHLLYVACTRARDFLFVSGAEPASEFVDDLNV